MFNTIIEKWIYRNSMGSPHLSTLIGRRYINFGNNLFPTARVLNPRCGAAIVVRVIKKPLVRWFV